MARSRRWTELRVGSSVTQNRSLAKGVFSPALDLSVCLTRASPSLSRVRVKHNGVTPGYLYIVSEQIDPRDIYPHPHPANADGWEWLNQA